jgi:GGDEF domain-containing protein
MRTPLFQRFNSTEIFNAKTTPPLISTRKSRSMKQILLAMLISFLIAVNGETSTLSSDKNPQQLLNAYYVADKELLITQDIANVAQAVVNHREQYNSNIVAKAYSLLSDRAFNHGDLLAAFQLAKKGSQLSNIDVTVQLNLLLKMARGYYAQGNYIELKNTSQKAAWLAEQANNMNYHLQALAYSVVAYALSADYSLAITELNRVEILLAQSQRNIDQITLLEIIAQAHFYLSEYDNTVEILNRVLKLRTDMPKTPAIARSYKLLANAYYQLQQFDDAYNAFWQSLQFAQQFKLNIRAANAELGLGQVLYQQQQFTKAKQRLENARNVFNQHNLLRLELSAQISLVKVLYQLNQTEEADAMLLSAQSLAENVVLLPQQIELFLLLTDYYIKQHKLPQAITMQKRYLSLYQDFYPNISVNNTYANAAKTTSSKTKQLALNIAEQSQLSLEFNDKYRQQQLFIILLAVALFCSVIVIIYDRFKLHRQQLHRGYDEIEIPPTHLAQPAETKRWYQQQYKMARKYQYNISIAYLEIENWQELNFHFNRKILADVSQALAKIINENLDEEDYAGVISAGEYLFLCPHQSPEQIEIKFTRIKQAIKTRFFVNLADYSVKIRYSIDAPTIQDIDPYVFLSRLSEGTSSAK